jgi:hypothetical protein
MATTPTFSLSGAARHAALFDEIEKISFEMGQHAPPQHPAPPGQKKLNVKKVLQAGAGYALGYGAGHVGGMAIERGLSHVFGKKWPYMSPEARQKVLYPALGVATVALMAVHQAANAKRQQAMESDE